MWKCSHIWQHQLQINDRDGYRYSQFFYDNPTKEIKIIVTQQRQNILHFNNPLNQSFIFLIDSIALRQKA